MARPVVVWDACVFIAWFKKEYAIGGHYSINDHAKINSTPKIG